MSDSVLLTGMNSNTVGRAERMKLKREEQKRIKQGKKSKLMPVAEIVLEEIQKEKDRTTLELIDSVDGFKTTDADHQAMMKSLQLYRESMNTLKARLSNILRAKDE